MAVLVAYGDAEDTFFGQQLRAVGAGYRLALVSRYLVGALRRLRAARTERADDVRHAPDAVLVGDEEVVVAPSEAVGPVEVLDIAIDPFGTTFAVVPQQGEIPGALLGHQHIAIGQHEQPARVGETGRKRCRGE